MDQERLQQILQETTLPLRKGEVVKEHDIAVGEHDEGDIHVIEVFNMPHESLLQPRHQKVDCHFIQVGVDVDKASAHKDELIELLRAYPEPDRLAGGPSYIEVGAVLGSQQLCLQLYALGQVLGLWQVITPATLGFEGAMADQLAGTGMVMISGFKGETE